MRDDKGKADAEREKSEDEENKIRLTARRATMSMESSRVHS